jgi:hypothetical protein
MWYREVTAASLADASFWRQIKPESTRYGEVYYKGKESRTDLDHLKLGDLSEKLEEALSMAPGHLPLGSTRSYLSMLIEHTSHVCCCLPALGTSRLATPSTRREPHRLLIHEEIGSLPGTQEEAFSFEADFDLVKVP